jgi:hypothetical protein
VDLPPPVAALRPGDPLEDSRADAGPEAVHLSIIGTAEIPAETTGSVLAAAQELQRQLPGLTSGEGVAETSFGGYRPLAAPAEQAQSRGGR